MTLLILAAGMGSRYGGLKQLDPITKNGEFIIDFSVYDAVINGFDKIVFVIKEENLELFRETIGKRFEKKVKVEYAFQKLENIPEGFSVPEGRVKPWGTTQAVLSARELINEPFAVINADDFYGRGAFEMLSKHLKSAGEAEYCMVGYILKNTLTENGTVSRGVCTVEDGHLKSINEMTKISRVGDIAVCNTDDGDVELPLDTIVSMNCWGFTPDVFEKLDKSFVEFLSNDDGNIKRECYLPMSVGEFMADGICTVKAYACEDKWYGVTYQEDREGVVTSLAGLIENGTYPDKLNENI